MFLVAVSILRLLKCKMRIAYCPISTNLESPGDYRRFVGYCTSNNLHFEVLKNEDLNSLVDGQFDFVVVTVASDLTFWAKNVFKKTKIIFDCVDSYIFLNNYKIKNILRAPAKFFSGQHSAFYLNYLDIIKIVARKSYGIVCSTERQKNFFVNFCSHVSVILDYHSSFINRIKKDFTLKKEGEFNLVWEGLPENICFNQSASQVIDFINKYNSSRKNQIKIKLNVFTDLYFKKFLNKFILQNAYYYLKKKSNYINFEEWDRETINDKIIENDLAIIPLSKNNPLEYGKPANKLFLFFKMGMPTITSNTYAYKEVENRFDLNLTFQDIDEFNEILNFYMFNPEARLNYSKNAINYINKDLPEKKLSSLWRGIFI